MAKAQPAPATLHAALRDELGSAADMVLATDNAQRLAAALLDLRGARLLSGNTDSARELRATLLNTLSRNTLAELYATTASSPPPDSRAELISTIASHRYTEGGTWATAFAKTVGLPPVFAGRRTAKPVANVSTVQPHRAPPTLKPFQADLRDRLLRVLRGEADHHRAIVSLPTGGGKTRTAGEALCALMDERLDGTAYFLWIAQSEELCEQAVRCFEQLWAGLPFSAPLTLYRYFGGRTLAPTELAGGLVVASIQQLAARLDAPGEVESAIFSGLRAVVIDEAHRATSSSYRKLFEAIARVNPLGNRLPVGGLTATPGRSGGETNDLIDAFGGVLLTPQLDDIDSTDPLEYFRSRGFLAYPDHESVATAYVPTARPPAGAQAHSRAAVVEYEAKLGRELARSASRNDVVLRRLVALPPGTPTLVYACSTEHVRVLHLLLRQAGRSSGFLLGGTPRAERHRLIEAFRRGELEFLVNYGVLTTGFDAPKTGCVAITRPIFSEVLYEQIVGRGLRGPAFGGTERCLVLDFEDNIATFGDQLAYHRFARFWDRAKRVKAAELAGEALPQLRQTGTRRKRGAKAMPGQAGLF